MAMLCLSFCCLRRLGAKRLSHANCLSDRSRGGQRGEADSRRQHEIEFWWWLKLSHEESSCLINRLVFD
jgi:hypothetical protein